MKIQKHFKQSLAVLLALVMTLALAPAAAAADKQCPICDYPLKMTVVHEANCHETGLAQYVCTNSSCKYGTVETLSVDNSSHDIVYTNNGNGTHSGACRYHTDYTEAASAHKYVNGVCSLCGATDYSAAAMDLPAERIVPVALNDSTAKLSAGNIRLTLGSANITDEYDLSYLWYDYSQNGRQVGSEEEYKLPSTIYGKEGTYYFMLIVNATPKGNISRAPLSQTCRITVKVEELVTASAVMTTEDSELRMGDANAWTPVSIADQIYDEIQSLCGRGVQPAYVVFNDVSSTSLGRLSASSTSTQYTFSGTTRALQDVAFISAGTAGDFLVGFTAYDTADRSYSGVLTITVQEYAGNMDVVYITSRSTPLTLSSKDFEKFWEVACPGGELEYISLDQLPRSVDGTIYTEYAASGLTGDTVRLSDDFYVDPGSRQYGIDELTFVPSVGVRQLDYITLDFTAYGVRSTGRSTNRSGVMYIFFTETEGSADVSVDVPAAAGAVGETLDPAAFRSAYEKVVGSAGSGFYIQFLDVPASGGLYINRTTANNGIRLTAANIEGRHFAYSGSRVETIADVTYVPGAAKAESIRYIACSTQGKALFAGNINFTSAAAATTTPAETNPVVTDLVKDYTSPATGVAFVGSDFENLLGEGNAKLTSVCFTPPTALYGTLYYNRTTVSAGTAITTNTNWFSVNPSVISGRNSIYDISFVPALSFTSGTVMIPFTALTDAGGRVNGNVRITVGASAPATTPETTTPTPGTTTTTPGTTTPAPGTTTTAPGTTVRPPKTFTDVPSNAVYYQAVTDLTTSGVLNGYEDGTFRPDNPITLGEALKLIMTGVGYPEQAPTGEGWASGYLSKAKEDNLLPDGMVERLDRTIDRYTYAQIMARAMKLQPAFYTVSPFADMSLDNPAAPSVIALNQLNILIGSQNPNNANEMVYLGGYAVTRWQFAIIIWRVQNYMQTGNAGGNIAA